MAAVESINVKQISFKYELLGKFLLAKNKILSESELNNPIFRISQNFYFHIELFGNAAFDKKLWGILLYLKITAYS